MRELRLKDYLDKIYKHYKRKHSSKDPVWNIHKFSNAKDIELIGFLTAVYSYGSVDQINFFIDRLLSRIGNEVHEFTLNYSKSKDKKYLNDLGYRFQKGSELALLFEVLSREIKANDSLFGLFIKNLNSEDQNILPALQGFVSELKSGKEYDRFFNHLLPEPRSGSACKRLNLFLRWMVRKDEIDLGIWNEIGTHRLLMPVDVHIHRIARQLGLVSRKSCDMKFALMLTERLKEFDPIDPVKYDFALCHVGIEKEEINI